MNTKYERFTHWVVTILFGAMMALSALFYLINPGFQQGFAHLGFPQYFRVELAVFKFAGVAALFSPVPRRLKEWAYAGFFIDLFSAFLAHLASGDGLKKAMAPASCALLLAVAYLTDRTLRHA